MTIKRIGYVRGTSDTDVWEIDGEPYAVGGFNGEKYMRCWKLKYRDGSGFPASSDSPDLVLRPIYRFEQENIDISEIEENSQEWDMANEIVDFDFCY